MKPVDLLRPREMRGLTKCERRFKKALKECPQLVDTTKRQKLTSEDIPHDTVYIDKIVDLTESVLDSIYAARAQKDTIRVVKGDTVYIYTPQPCTLTQAEKKAVKDKIRDEVINTMDPPKLLSDTLNIPFETGNVKVWQKGNKLWHLVQYQNVTLNNPCPDQFGLNWIEILLIGLSGGFFLGLFFFFAVVRRR